MINIFRGSYSEGINIKNILENNKTEVYTTNGLMVTLEPWVVTPGGYDPVAIRVKKGNSETVGKIIEKYQNGDLELKEE